MDMMGYEKVRSQLPTKWYGFFNHVCFIEKQTWGIGTRIAYIIEVVVRRSRDESNMEKILGCHAMYSNMVYETYSLEIKNNNFLKRYDATCEGLC